MLAFKVKQKGLITGFALLLLGSCQTLPSADSVYNNSRPNASSSNSTIASREREYQDLVKVYKSDRVDVLNDLLGGDNNTKQTSIVVNNNSSCNMVLTITSKNMVKKVPIEAGKAGFSMVDRNQQYTLTGYACNASFNHSKYVTESYIISIK